MANFTTDGTTITHSALFSRSVGISSGRFRISSSTAPAFSSRSFSLRWAELVVKGYATRKIAASVIHSFLMPFLRGRGLATCMLVGSQGGRKAYSKLDAERGPRVDRRRAVHWSII